MSFPNVLGGRDTFSPIRAKLLGPDIRQTGPHSAQAVSLELMKEPSLADMRANLNSQQS
ncbi:MAG: hypothetical protein QM757_16200 [Paludibaculum sp.]